MLLRTGGGPGAMKAGHVGATFSHASDLAFEQALTTLAGRSGTVNAWKMIRRRADWFLRPKFGQREHC
jgi:hypothetical protein